MEEFAKEKNKKACEMRAKRKSKIPFLFFLSSFLFISCVSTKYPLSDHYDGKRFYNPTQKEDNGIWRTLKLLATIHFEKWPDHVQNEETYRIKSPLHKNEVAITFINHATVLIQFQGINILTDPVWSERISPVSWAGTKRVREPGISIKELPQIHLVVISHNHYDHLDIETLKTLNRKFSPKFLVPLGDKKLLQSEGIFDTEEMDWWQTIRVRKNTEVTFAPTQHLSARGIFDWNHSLWGSYMIKMGNKRVYFGGDAAYSSHYKEIRKRLGSPDISLLPIGAYEPRWFMRLVHMNPSDAIQAHKDLGSKLSIGMHFGTFQQTEESIDAPVDELKKEILRTELNPDRFIVQKEGITRIY
ncbi:MBL fold metallo-hydrolase [Leptospira wolffii]|uniref:MBL fold metallo-hydrolase n=1 Tax=Leptospira wolffii TaxID=409998 RepID=UPI0003021DE1|nr:MBL fold metallo-hydrolase [Leptospira wolffii]EPG66217.1 beta-lactamase family protein [Leptospira wolffii serovar Khorat str. Khorat-H2]